MKKAFGLAVLAAVLIPATHAGAAAPPPTQTPAQATVQPADPLAEILLPTAAPAPSATLPYCGSYDGMACTTPGGWFRCQWIPGEPGVCVCTSAHLWTCG